jgi:hypothetical protein
MNAPAVIALIVMAASSRRSTALVSLRDPPIAARWQARLMSAAMDDETVGWIVRRHCNRDVVAGNDLDMEATQPPADTRDEMPAVVTGDAKVAAGHHFRNSPWDLQQVVFRQDSSSLRCHRQHNQPSRGGHQKCASVGGQLEISPGLNFQRPSSSFRRSEYAASPTTRRGMNMKPCIPCSSRGSRRPGSAGRGGLHLESHDWVEAGAVSRPHPFE